MRHGVLVIVGASWSLIHAASGKNYGGMCVSGERDLKIIERQATVM